MSYSDFENQRLLEIQDAKSKCVLFGVLSLISWLLPIAGIINAIYGIKYSLKAENGFTMLLNVIGILLTLANAVGGIMMSM
jgi:hypothetical protein